MPRKYNPHKTMPKVHASGIWASINRHVLHAYMPTCATLGNKSWYLNQETSSTWTSLTSYTWTTCHPSTQQETSSTTEVVIWNLSCHTIQPNQNKLSGRPPNKCCRPKTNRKQQSSISSARRTTTFKTLKIILLDDLDARLRKRSLPR